MYRNISQHSEKISRYIAIRFSCIVTPLLGRDEVLMAPHMFFFNWPDPHPRADQGRCKDRRAHYSKNFILRPEGYRNRLKA